MLYCAGKGSNKLEMMWKKVKSCLGNLQGVIISATTHLPYGHSPEGPSFKSIPGLKLGH